MAIKISASYDSFRELRESGSYYVDKTDFIEEYLLNKFDKAVMFTRPRRFGKTLTMTMLRDFLDVRQDSREIFEGLKIMDCHEAVDGYMNKYPVLFISLKEVYGESYDNAYNNLKLVVSELSKTFDELLISDEIGAEDKILLRTMRAQEGDNTNTVAALGLLSRMLCKHYKKPVFVIVDEYDVPTAKSLNTPYYDKVRDMIEHMLSFVCKTNENVKGVVLSGCLYTVKNSTYTGVNNIIPYSILTPNFASSIGFTDDEVRRLLDDAGIQDRYGVVEEWYDGYIFGRNKMFCPWDVLLYVRSVLDGSYSDAMGPENYWVNTSETTQNIIHGFLGKTGNADEGFEQLLAGKTIECTVNDSLPYHLIHENGDNLWSALLETGYLTKAVTERMKVTPLRIPNKEIKAVFRQEVWEHFKDHVDNVTVKDFVNALWAGEISNAQSALAGILEATLSFYHEYHEYSYHLILDGFFTGFGYTVDSERETGYGRSDLIIRDPGRKRGMILELKHVEKEADMEAALKEASDQMIVKKYESRLDYEGYTTRLRYGMAFCDKKCLIGKV